MLYRSSFIIYLLLFLRIPHVTAQDGQIMGSVISLDTKPLPYATLLLSNADDSLLCKAVANGLGHFMVRAKPGKYRLKVTAVGFQTQDLPINFTAGGTLRPSPIVMTQDVRTLNEVTVTGPKRAIDFQAGKTIVTPSASPLLSQGSLMDILKRIPGITVDEDGTLYLNGQKGVNLLVNGKSTHLSGPALISLLQSTSTNAINQIEVLSSPTSEYDASGSAGLINIKLKRASIHGLTFSTNLNFQQGKDSRGDAGIQTTIRKKNVGLGVDYSHFNGEKAKRGSLQRTYQHAAGNRSAQQNLSLTNNDRSHNLRLYVDGNISDQVSFDSYLGTVLYGREIPGNSFTTFSSAHSKLDSLLNTQTLSNYHQETISSGIRTEYKSKEQLAINLSLDYLSFRHDEELQMNSSMRSPQLIASNDQVGDLNNQINMISGQTNLSSPIGKLAFQFGAKYTKVSIGNDAIYNRQMPTGTTIRFDYSSRYAYEENNHAVYTQFSGKFTSWSFTAGVRLENTRIEGMSFNLRDTSTDSAYQIRYLKPFPSVALQYSLNDNTDLSISYNRRITRPNYRDLSPFGYLVDEYIMIQGNSDLQAELTNNVQAAITWKKNYRASIFHSKTKDVINQGFRERDNGGILIIPENIASRMRLGAKVDIMNMPDLKWWHISSSLSVFYTTNSWNEMSGPKTSSSMTPSASITSSFFWGKRWTGEINGYYNGKMTLGQMYVPARWSVSAGVRKMLWTERCSVRLYANDIFASLMEDVSFQTGTLSGISKLRNDETAVGLSISYYLKKGQHKVRRSNQSIDESQRINF